MRFRIERLDKLNGKTRWNVYAGCEWIGQFYTRERAQAFVESEAVAAFAYAAIAKARH